MYGRISVPSYGPRGAEVALLGQSPGREEELLGRPFVGPAGRFARRVFEEAGYEWGSIYRFNVFSKRLLSVKDRNALMRDIAASRERIEREVASLRNLKLLVAAGNEAIYAVSGKWGAIKLHGSSLRPVIYVPNGLRILAIVHPSFVLRNGGESSRWYGRLLEALRKERQLLPVLSKS